MPQGVLQAPTVVDYRRGVDEDLPRLLTEGESEGISGFKEGKIERPRIHEITVEDC